MLDSMGLAKKYILGSTTKWLPYIFVFFKRLLNILRTIWRPSWIFGIEKVLILFLIIWMNSWCLKTSVETPKYYLNCQSGELGYTSVFRKMTINGGGHLELKKSHNGDFWGLFCICLGRCSGITRTRYHRWKTDMPSGPTFRHDIKN